MNALAYEQIQPQNNHPTLVWLCGYRSNMNGTKVKYLKTWAEKNGFGFFCFDYSGHGQSAGKLEDGTISGWLEESYELISRHVNGQIILIGSSMGAWIALRLAEIFHSEYHPICDHNHCYGAKKKARFVKILKLILFAPAPDFTEDLIWQKLTYEQQQNLMATGKIVTPSRYSEEPNMFLLSFIEDGRTQCVLNRPYRANCSVHILHGTLDLDVPLFHGHKLMVHLAADNVTFTQIFGGDHRLSRNQDIELLVRSITSS